MRRHMQKNGKSIFVAVSGGVDSSVALALLKKQGYAVTGCFMKNWSRNMSGLTCNWAGEREDAMRVCAALNVPFRTVDLEETYVKKVFRNFVGEYKKGRTPNPDVLSKSEVKFKAFLQWALRNGAEYIATGHYARIERKFSIFSSQFSINDSMHRFSATPLFNCHNENSLKIGNCKLKIAKDANKDQSYFLYRLGQKELARVLFPVGEYAKPDVRKMAHAFMLPTAEKKDSQGVCFMGEVALQQFLRGWIPEKPGNIIHLSDTFSQSTGVGTERAAVHFRNHPEASGHGSRVLRGRVSRGQSEKSRWDFERVEKARRGERIGTHAGIHYFTIGQRHGLGLPGGSQRPLYVAAKDVKKNVLYVAEKNHPALYVKTLALKDVYWVSGSAPKLPLACRARIRYRQPLQSCTIAKSKTGGSKSVIRAAFCHAQWAPAPGQSVVFYHRDNVLGGGIIL